MIEWLVQDRGERLLLAGWLFRLNKLGEQTMGNVAFGRDGSIITEGQHLFWHQIFYLLEFGAFTAFIPSKI